jgi:cell division protein FtsW
VTRVRTGVSDGAEDEVSARWRAGRAALTAWLARPLTSLHLVLAAFGLLTAFGLVMVLSASSVESYAQDGSSYVVFTRQLAYCVAGLVLFWLGLRTPLRTIRKIAFPALVITSFLLLLVLTPLGATINGARSWFRIGGLSFQPAEPVKLALALWGAQILTLKRALLHTWRHLLIPLVPVALVLFTLLMLQPDLGTTVTVATIMLALLWFAGAPMQLFAVTAGGAVTGAMVMISIAGYRSARLDSFLNPSTADPLGPAFQARQALFSLADGGWWGVGLGQGRSKWLYLPNAHNDFIFAIIGEELGLIGCVVVLALFGVLAYTGFRIANRCTDPWARLVAATLTTWLVSQAAINIGYVVGLLPITGLPLPLISSGGTSLAMTMLVFGLLANLARHEPQAVAALRTSRDAAGQAERRRGLLRLPGGVRLPAALRLPLPEPYRSPRPARPAAGATPPARRPAGGRDGDAGPVEHRDRPRGPDGRAGRRDRGWGDRGRDDWSRDDWSRDRRSRDDRSREGRGEAARGGGRGRAGERGGWGDRGARGARRGGGTEE